MKVTLTDTERANLKRIQSLHAYPSVLNEMADVVESIVAAHVAGLLNHITWYVGDEYDKDGDTGLCDRIRALADEFDPAPDNTTERT